MTTSRLLRRPSAGFVLLLALSFPGATSGQPAGSWSYDDGYSETRALHALESSRAALVHARKAIDDAIWEVDDALLALGESRDRDETRVATVERSTGDEVWMELRGGLTAVQGFLGRLARGVLEKLATWRPENGAALQPIDVATETAPDEAPSAEIASTAPAVLESEAAPPTVEAASGPDLERAPSAPEPASDHYPTHGRDLWDEKLEAIVGGSHAAPEAGEASRSERPWWEPAEAPADTQDPGWKVEPAAADSRSDGDWAERGHDPLESEWEPVPCEPSAGDPAVPPVPATPPSHVPEESFLKPGIWTPESSPMDTHAEPEPPTPEYSAPEYSTTDPTVPAPYGAAPKGYVPGAHP